MLLGKSVSDPAIDWWSFGVLMYEFLVGLPPFNDQTPEKIFANILGGQLTWPPIGYGDNMMTPEAYELISNLLVPDPGKRYSPTEIKSHKFFQSSILHSLISVAINWTLIRKQQPPIWFAEDEEVCNEFISSPLKRRK